MRGETTTRGQWGKEPDLTERVKSPGLLLLGLARKLPWTPRVRRRCSASIPVMLGWNHLERQQNRMLSKNIWYGILTNTYCICWLQVKLCSTSSCYFRLHYTVCAVHSCFRASPYFSFSKISFQNCFIYVDLYQHTKYLYKHTNTKTTGNIYVILHHKSSHKGTFFKIEMYISSDRWINMLSIDVPVRIWLIWSRYNNLKICNLRVQ